MAPTVGLTIVFYREFFANPLITRLSFVLFHILRDALFSGGEFAPEGRLDFIRDGKHQVGPDGQAAGRGEKVHAAEERFTDLFAKQIVQDPAHLAVQLTGDGEHFPVVRDFFSRGTDFLLQRVQLGEGTGEAFQEIHVGGVERDRHLPGEEIFLNAICKREILHGFLPFGR